MLLRVGLGQIRFNVPGLKPDHRGVVTGRAMVFRFAALERLVSFLRLWSGEQALDDFQPGLRLLQVRTTVGTREVLVLVPVISLPLVEAAARAARLAGGQCFTGGGKHFVLYRDSQAPLGYDADTLESPPASTEFVLYGADHTLAYTVMSDLALDRLLLRMDLQRQPPDVGARRDLLFLTVRRGLGPLVIGYLHRAVRQNPTLRVAAALCEPPSEATFQRRSALWILRLENLPARFHGALSGTPGLSLFVPVADNVAVASGYRHPVHLGSCKTVFPSDRLFLFAPAPRGVTVVHPTPSFVAVEDLVRLQPFDLGPRSGSPAAGQGEAPEVGEAPQVGEAAQVDVWRVAPARTASVGQLAVPLRLEPAAAGQGRAVATLVPWAQAHWVRSLCYALPPPAVRGYRLALIELGVLVVAPDTLDAFPFGKLFHAPAPGLLVPLGWELRPSVAPEQLANRVGATGGALVIFPGPGQPPFRVPADAISTLEARALADRILSEIPAVSSVGPDSGAARETFDIEIENQPLGPMPLWRMGR